MLPIPNFKGVDFFPHDTRIDFMRFKDICFWASVAAMVISLGLFFAKGLNYGVDFKGGSMIELKAKSGTADVAALRGDLGALKLGDVQIQQFGGAGEVLVRLEQQPGGEEAQQIALRKVTSKVDAAYELRRVEVVGPAVSSELRRTGTIAVLAGIFAIVLYVWFRFEWQFALGTVLALSHDTLLTVGLFSLLGLEFDLSTVAALLTILGYSVNDTVVISDRIRENLRRFKRMELKELLNLSINETLSRTLLTSSTTIIVLIALLLLGGSVIRNFTFAMLFGIVVGTYSSIFIAAPVLDYMHIKRETIVGEEKGAGNAKA
ncbi:MAG: protein translocase subunit SecF [Hyphomicrobiaceae bacterium]